MCKVQVGFVKGRLFLSDLLGFKDEITAGADDREAAEVCNVFPQGIWFSELSATDARVSVFLNPGLSIKPSRHSNK